MNYSTGNMGWKEIFRTLCTYFAPVEGGTITKADLLSWVDMHRGDTSPYWFLWRLVNAVRVLSDRVPQADHWNFFEDNNSLLGGTSLVMLFKTLDGYQWGMDFINATQDNKHARE